MKMNKLTNNKRRNFTLKVFETRGVQRYETSSLKRFLNHVRRINWKNGVKKAYVRVSYGKHIDQSGKLTTFFNDGDYDNQIDFEASVAAFLEK